MNAIAYPHIHIRDGMAYIEDTRLKVVHLIIAHRFSGWDAQQIREQYPSLSLAQIHSALAYYYDNQAEMDRVIEERARLEDQMIAEQGVTPVREKLLKAKYGRLP
jgi:uncharacterized protein (DUF433 family)